ncbi:hypothetical protein CCP3SC15_910007 [Gammaproteobacteria bacterium]
MVSKGNTQGANQSNINFTKEELMDEIKRLTDVVSELQDQINKQAASAHSGRKGWMISTPNPAYTGTTAGVYFENGHAFVSADLVDARKKVSILTHDFGYSATETMDGQEIKAPPSKKQTIFEAGATPQQMN